MTEEIWWDEEEEDAPNPLDYARRLDVHCWSDHPEINGFVDNIFQELSTQGNAGIRRRHLKVVLLDLYVAWSSDPALKISYSRSPNAYHAGSIYNELHISRTTIDVVDWLIAANFVENQNGFFDRRPTGRSRISRMWPTEELVSLFREARFSVFDISWQEDRLLIQLKDMSKTLIEFEMSSGLENMSEVLQEYNKILNNTFVSIPHLESPRIEKEADENNPSKFDLVTQSNKFTRRIFNNSSFEEGGRFYGGFWQNCRKHLRNDILINDQITIEIDYSSLHPTMLYAMEGIDYWSKEANDPYSIEPVSFLSNPDELRSLVKGLFLILLNADSLETIPQAFRNGAANGSPQKKLTNAQIHEVVDQIRALHNEIEGHFHTGIGTHLQYRDSQITNEIVRHFNSHDEPILLVHDSYIVRQGWEEELELIMQRSFSDIMGEGFSSREKYVGHTYDDVMNELYARYNFRQSRGTQEEEDEDLALYREVAPNKTERYLSELRLFNEWVQQAD